MKTINLNQGSNEWKEWRKSHVTGTDAPIIIGASEYCTPYLLWQRKLGLMPEQTENEAMKRGRLLEPIAREQFSAQFGIVMTPIVAESTEHEFLGVSLDGISDCGKFILEIKCNGKKNHDLACKGEVPNAHWVQMQTQMFVAGAILGYYYSFDGNEGKCIEVPFDPNYCDSLIPRLRDFWRNLILFEPPAMTDRDFRDMSQDLSWDQYATLYRSLDTEIKIKEERKDEVRRKLIELCDNQPSKGCGVKLQKTITKGRVEYDKIEILQSIDLDQYRKNPSTSWRVYVE